MYTITPFLTCRAQIISTIIFILQYYCSKELIKTNKKRYYFILFLLPIILVNIHGTIFITYFIFYLPFIVEYFLGKIKLITGKFKGIEFYTSKYYKNLMIVIFINIFEGLLSPNGFLPYTTILNSPINYFSKYINELKPISKDFVSLFVLYFIIFFLYRERPKAHETFMLLGLGIMGILHRRSLFHFFLIGFIIIIEFLNKTLSYLNYTKIKEKTIRNTYNCSIIIILILSILQFHNNLNMVYLPKTKYPINSTEYLLKEVDLSKEILFNDFNVGSYLEYYGIKTFMDSRATIFTKPFNDTTILYDYSEIYLNYKNQPDYKEFFKKYKFTIALVSKNSTLYTKIKHDKSNSFQILYEDDYFLIYRI